MSPEQARAQAVDKRADIWAFGCILYEMLTGRAAFAARRLTDILANVLKEEPDYSALPADTPPLTRRLVAPLSREGSPRASAAHRRRARRPARLAGAPRLGLGAARPALRPQSNPGSGSRTTAQRRGARRRSVARHRRRRRSRGLAGRAAGRAGDFEVASGRASKSAMYPLIARSAANHRRLSRRDARSCTRVAKGSILRSLVHADQVQARWESTERVPSSRRMASGSASSGGSPRKLDPRLGAAAALPPSSRTSVATAGCMGASWGPDDRIVFATTLGLYRVAAGGGEPELLVSPDPDQHELYFLAPEILPGGRTVLFTVASTRSESRSSESAALDSRCRSSAEPF